MRLLPPRPPGADGDLDPIEQRVALDRESYRPLRVESLDGHTAYDIAEIETVTAEDADFSEPKPAAPRSLVSGGNVVSSTDIGLDEARSLLGVRAFWAGQTVHGLGLTKATHDVLRTTYARSTGLEPRTTDREDMPPEMSRAQLRFARVAYGGLALADRLGGRLRRRRKEAVSA